jgi:carbon storage regulator
MLVLSRKPGEKVIIGDNIVLTVVSVGGNRVRLGIDAPEDTCILRAELAEWQDLANEYEERTKVDVLASSHTPIDSRRCLENLEGDEVAVAFLRRSR